MASLDYMAVFKLAEEIQKLKGSRLKAVFAVNQTTYLLELATKQGPFLLTFDLSPGSPRFFCQPLDFSLKIKKTLTPTLNFLKAHFVGKTLEGVYVAEKPDRTIKLLYEENRILTFRCYPQRAQLDLEAGGKRVFQPFYADFKPNPDLSFVEPEPAEGWGENEKYCEPRARPEEPSKNLGERQLAKLEKALEKLVAADAGEKSKELKDIENWNLEASEIKASPGSKKGRLLTAPFEKIKKTKTKQDVRLKRIADLKAKMEEVKLNPPQILESKVQKKKKEKAFSGLMIGLPSGGIFLIGRNADQNEELLKLAQPHETWIHLRDYPGAHGLIRHARQEKSNDIDLDFACSVVAIFSRNPKKQFQEGEVLEYYAVPRKFLKKPKGSPRGHVIVERETVRRVAFKVVRFMVLTS